MLAPGVVLDRRYHLVELLARGGMADVFKARDVRLGRDVAVKAFRVGTADVRRFELETRVLAGFDHPNLVRVLDAGDAGGQPYLVLELIDGPTLAYRLGGGPLARAEAHRLATDISRALARVHDARIVHRDVKPSNILLAPDGRALLGDFGIALLLDATRLTAAAQVPGTAAYLAPEQVSGGAVTTAADIYSLGLVLIEAFTGRPAFEGTPQEVMAARLARAPAVPPDLPRPWPELLTAMTGLDPATRPAAAAVHVALTGADAAPTIVAQPTEVLAREPTTPGRPRRGLWVAGLAAIAVLALATLLARSERTNDDTPPTTASSTTTTALPTTVTSTTTPPTTARPPVVANCVQFEAAKQAIEAEKQQAEARYRDDPAVRERLKKQLEEQKRRIEADKKAAGC